MQMILFKMNQQYYLISAASVEEVIDTVRITRVPLAPSWVKGLINLRGTVMTVIGLSELIGVPTSESNHNILIMKKDDERKGLLIEEVVEVVDIDKEDIQLEKTDKEKHYLGIVSLEDKVANVVDVNHLIF
ncbi:chemotaxis protein CheW [Liquorilactobacillus sucicola DSM 21376 = JCM 15457]|uniref:Chemotaxis protein CheW n=2 Tax=Liquorilactobacillus sucicola TaxID=519050 RepID=A0A023CXN2_9LACO|nr:chemotaxis protein CheW [Liquorilactobacillus sucicola]AJA34354.1 purine-binding chemotaxis protein CheW [Liquorilactobacillus sucicola]KRN06864.1 chemotaxis protein CheW [Liquorilactobacillus sucicola DSM 21376 = JCM 15457]GAJ26341.1 chemotaxis protein CheW [Liquorilactobacillus sucicola DSM 21376 = JCM 15457]